MWKHVLAVGKRNRSVWRGCALVCLLVSAACAPASDIALPPTQTLIPATATFTPSPVPPSATPAPDLAAPNQVGLGETTASAETGLVGADPVAAELVQLAQRRVAQITGLPIRRITLVAFHAFTWQDTSLGCPTAGESYTAVLVDGYRIVLQAGDQAYIFHTDVDRLIPCAERDERLPPTPTPHP